MKTNRILAVALLGLSTLTPQFPTAFAQGTGFIYQGRLDSGGVPHTGSAEFQPTLWNAASGGNQIAVNAPTSNTL